MKRVYIMNGWRDCPELWWRYLLLPFGRVDKTPQWYSVSLFGFAIFWIR